MRICTTCQRNFYKCRAAQKSENSQLNSSSEIRNAIELTIPRMASNRHLCLFGHQSRQLRRVPAAVREKILVNHRLYVPSGARCKSEERRRRGCIGLLLLLSQWPQNCWILFAHHNSSMVSRVGSIPARDTDSRIISWWLLEISGTGVKGGNREGVFRVEWGGITWEGVGSWTGSKTGRNFLRERWGEELMQNKSIYFY
jgi:hypothetical protein